MKQAGGVERQLSRECLCDGVHVQTEKHVLLECAMTAGLRNSYQMLRFGDISDIMEENIYIQEVCSYIFEVLSIYV